MVDDQHYSEICTNIRVSDDISFKLLGLVPLISGSGILVALLKGEALGSPAIFLVSLFGALVTFGLFRWELRNIQTCNWLIDRASDIEKNEIEKTEQKGKVGQFYRRSKASELKLGGTLRLGKTEAEKLIYTVTILTWIALPWAESPPAKSQSVQTILYAIVAVLIGLLTLHAAISKLPGNLDDEKGEAETIGKTAQPNAAPDARASRR